MVRIVASTLLAVLVLLPYVMGQVAPVDASEGSVTILSRKLTNKVKQCFMLLNFCSSGMYFAATATAASAAARAAATGTFVAAAPPHLTNLQASAACVDRLAEGQPGRGM